MAGLLVMHCAVIESLCRLPGEALETEHQAVGITLKGSVSIGVL